MSKLSLLQFDDFAPDFLEVRENVIKEGFSTRLGPDGAEYTNTSLYPVDHWFLRIGQLINKKIEPKLSVFRQNLAGEMPHSFVHSDEICANYASVLYMNLPDQCLGGTAFWRHSFTGIEYSPTNEELVSAGQDPLEFGVKLTQAWKDKSQWSPAGFCAMKSNRFIAYPTRKFHSRWPWEGFGLTPQNARFIWAAFWDIVE